MRLKDKVAIVTGGARGIGREYSLKLAEEGAKVVACDVLDCGETVAEIAKKGGRALALETNVTDSKSVQAMADATVEKFGRIDVLVNNAAIYGGLKMTPLEQIDEGEWDRVMAVNVKGMWLASRAVIPVMRKQGSGRIINISSGTVWMGIPYLLHYVTSKGAVVALTRAMARELAETGINVNGITPGFTMTEASLGIASPETIEGIKQMLLMSQIIKRNEEPKDLVGTVVFLASSDSDFITGQMINVDGGAIHH